MLASRLLTFPLRDLLEINCWLATIPAPALTNQGVRVESLARTAGIVDALVFFKELTLNVSCIDCSSPGIQQLSELVQSDEAAQSTTNAANILVGWAGNLLDGEFVQIFLDRAINEAPARCPHSPSYDPNYAGLELEPFAPVDPPGDSIWFLIAVAIGIVGAVLIILVVGFIVKILVRRRHRRWLKTLPNNAVFRIYREQKKEDENELFLREQTSSMFTSNDIPKLVRYGIPVVILGNIALFLSGHLSIGGAVNVYIHFAGEDIVLENIFEFSVAQSAVQLWEAGGKQLAILILIFSGYVFGSGMWPLLASVTLTWYLSHPQSMAIH